jgi:hypothetical protein
MSLRGQEVPFRDRLLAWQSRNSRPISAGSGSCKSGKSRYCHD